MRFSTRTVSAILSSRSGLQRVDLSGRPAYVLTELIGPVAVGDRVIVNETAVDLELGTGGFDVVHWNLSRSEFSSAGGGPVLKLRYTSLQVDTGVAEDASSFSPPDDLGDMPVVVCTLHSQVGCVAGAFHSLAPQRRLVFVMTDSAALPLALSDLVASLVDSGALVSTVTFGQAFGGAYEAVNVYSALQVALGLGRADAVVVGPGPGVVGTDSTLGFSGLEVAGVVDAAARLNGTPVLAVRYSDVERRTRHHGVSHHTTTALSLMEHRPVVPVPIGQSVPELGSVVQIDVPELDLAFIESMGRTADEDPAFFRFAAAAGAYAAQLVATS
ncbi:MAG TPA: DUF3866 family protein [Acidimicrobiales bacterium]|nr:DUF3866 family protein [Acidimicrobiales bacterium]